jgi:hypothetical protein
MYTRWLTCRLISFAVIAPQTFLVEKEKESNKMTIQKNRDTSFTARAIFRHFHSAKMTAIL